MLTRRAALHVESTLTILDVVLAAARDDLARCHPVLDDFLRPGSGDGAVELVARLLLARLDDLRDLAATYRRVLDTDRGVDPF